jgi:hypothetical protein
MILKSTVYSSLTRSRLFERFASALRPSLWARKGKLRTSTNTAEFQQEYLFFLKKKSKKEIKKRKEISLAQRLGAFDQKSGGWPFKPISMTL